MAQAMFGAGCFWGVEAAFRQLAGVTDTAVGFAGGTVPDPGYRRVCTGTTGHAEVVHLTFDPDAVSYEALLKTFWGCHDPTTRNRQGPDVGSQYRSIIFTYDAAQAAAAASSKAELARSGALSRPVVTEIVPAAPFYRAEEDHQQYFEKQGIAHCPAPRGMP